MGKISILTKNQKAFLSVLKTNPYIKENFYFTGGTVLTEYYLKHRYSDDLDFFSEQKIDTSVILATMREWSQKLHFTFTERFVEVVYRFVLKFPTGEPLKVDFGYYPYKRIQPSILNDGLYIDSEFDIATNKMTTISRRASVKDFVDLYYLYPKYGYWDLFRAVEKKFNLAIDKYITASDMTIVDTFTTLPRMIKPLTLPKLQTFFRKTAIELAQDAVEK